MIQEKRSEQEIRKCGLCPHSLRKCERAAACLLSIRDACLWLIQHTVSSCYSCKKKAHCPTRFKCFRETGKGIRI